MRIITWNINGLRAAIKKSCLKPLWDLKPDFICFQETKLSSESNLREVFPFPYCTFNQATSLKGYSGTALLSQKPPLHTILDFPPEKHHGEGRTITSEFEKFFLVNVYTPNSQAALKRLPYRHQSWDPDFRAYLKMLSEKKPVIACGDFNVAHEAIDLAHPKANEGSPCFTPEEREGFSKLLAEGYVDIFRYFHPGEKGHYTFWSYRTQARGRNIGWRLDYILVTPSLLHTVKDVKILCAIEGSDHAPVCADFDLE